MVSNSEWWSHWLYYLVSAGLRLTMSDVGWFVHEIQAPHRILCRFRMSQHFCGTCNRLRLTADGQMKVCLFDGSMEADNGMISLRDAIRAGFTELELRKLIYMAVQKKHAVLGGHSDPTHIMNDAANNRPMTLIGG
jgi:molybdenum cofactor biosynthesis enzyme MoaA